MDLSFSPQNDAFRQEPRAFIRDHYPAEIRVANPLFSSRPSWDGVFQGKPDSAFFDIPE
jgi:hypothetical protein